MTQPEQISLTGRAYLVAATHLLQDIRLEHPYAGVWEAADLQWWWRKPRSTDSVRQAFWTDADGRSLGAAIRTDWNGTIGLDVIAHQGGENFVGFDGVFDPHLHQAARLRIDRGVP